MKHQRVAAVQTISAGSIAGNLETIKRTASSAALDGTDVVLFPECATTGVPTTLDLLARVHGIERKATSIGFHFRCHNKDVFLTGDSRRSHSMRPARITKQTQP